MLNGPRDMAKVKEAESRRLQRRESRVARRDGFPGPQGHVRCRRGHAATGRDERRLQLRPTGARSCNAAPAERPVGPGRLERLLHRLGGSDMLNPAGHLSLRANGDNAWFGWPNDPKIEELRSQWFTAPDQVSQQKIAAELQQEVFVDVPMFRLGNICRRPPSTHGFRACRTVSPFSGTCRRKPSASCALRGALARALRPAPFLLPLCGRRCP